MIKIEIISNGFVLHFKNENDKKVKLYFQNFESMVEWLQKQIQGIITHDSNKMP